MAIIKIKTVGMLNFNRKNLIIWVEESVQLQEFYWKTQKSKYPEEVVYKGQTVLLLQICGKGNN
jgi:hypothetical protein